MNLPREQPEPSDLERVAFQVGRRCGKQQSQMLELLQALDIHPTLPQMEILQAVQRFECPPVVDLRRRAERWLVHHPNLELAERVRSDLERQQVLGHFPDPPEPSNRAARRHPK